MAEVPDETGFNEDEPAKWRIPGTSIRIIRIDDGPREGEFLFSGRTVKIAPWFYQRISHRPLRSTLGVESWVEFYAIREDIFLRVNDIVADSGTSFAFPSQTLYMGRDEGVDDERRNAAKEQVESWRRSGILPYPSPTEENIERLENTLDFPPRGSPGARDPEAHPYEVAEPLSANGESLDVEDEEKPETSQRL